MMVITGAAGFIGSCLAAHFAQKGAELLLVDDFANPAKWNNLQGLEGIKRADRKDYILDPLAYGIPDWVLHIGARTDTAEMDVELFNELNLNYSKAIWTFCADHEIPLIYASSAATYGAGGQGFSDRHEMVLQLHPLNPYGQSKQDMDVWALQQQKRPPFWTGLKFFNVFGPNEYHKGRMASVVFHTYHQVRKNGHMKLFRSHHPNFKDGEQKRDFIYVRDLIRQIEILITQRPESGIYNVGTGEARTFLDLAHAVFKALNLEPQIEFMDTPLDIRDKYQYFTEADMTKWKSLSSEVAQYSLEEAINEYVKEFLVPLKYYQHSSLV